MTTEYTLSPRMTALFDEFDALLIAADSIYDSDGFALPDCKEAAVANWQRRQDVAKELDEQQREEEIIVIETHDEFLVWSHAGMTREEYQAQGREKMKNLHAEYREANKKGEFPSVLDYLKHRKQD